MRTLRLCAVVSGILALSLNVAHADGQFTILGDASYINEPRPIVATAYQDAGAVPPPPGDAGQPMPDGGEMAPPPSGAPYGYMGPTPSGPAVIENGWCDVWGNCCDPCFKLGYIVAGVEATFLWAVDEPKQFVRFTDLTTGERDRGESDSGLGAGVRTWLGLEQCGYGIRARYWYFGNDLIDVDPEVLVGNGPGFLESYRLRVNVFDVEMYHRFCFTHLSLEASLGARYAHIERTGAVTGYGTVGGVDLLGLAIGSNEIEGTGFTASIGGTKPLSCCYTDSCDSCCDTCCNPCSRQCGLNFFWNFRGSVLWADSTVSALTDANASVKPPFGAAQATSRDKAFAYMNKDNVWNTEIQLGLEYNFCVCCVPGIFSLRGGAEWQHWDTGDLVAHSNSFAFLQGGPPPIGGLTEAYADAHDGDLDLIGFFVGLQWRF